MIRYLIKRPISVLMVFLAMFIIGSMTYLKLPVSLLPNIDIPQINVMVDGRQMSARELQNTIVVSLCRELTQVSGVREVRSETQNGSAMINVRFDYGKKINLAFIEVNEKLDVVMGAVNQKLPRPKVVRVNAGDIPIYYVNLMLKDPIQDPNVRHEKFLELSDLADNVVRRRIEQLPAVALVDITGQSHKCIRIVPRREVMDALGVEDYEIRNVLNANNIDMGRLTVRKGAYEYQVRAMTALRRVEDVQNIFFSKGGRVFRLKDLADIQLSTETLNGLSLCHGRQAITMGIVKQANAPIETLKKDLKETISQMEKEYPEVSFVINRNQTELLDYAISNLKQNLALGLILIFITALLFLGDLRSPLIISASVVTALVSSMLFFFLFHQSLNIITISGLILALGMMIDSAIIVTDIIAQYRSEGYGLTMACVRGTNEVITPILSSTLTTIAVFVPLVFMSNMAGAIFFAQAFAISVGLLLSYLTGIILLPVLYRLIYSLPKRRRGLEHLLGKLRDRIDHKMSLFYDKGIALTFRHKWLTITLTFLSIPLCIVLFRAMPKSSMPEIDHTEMIVHIDWNDHIYLGENRHRVEQLMAVADSITKDHAAYVGRQSYLIDKGSELTASQSELYFKVAHPSDLKPLTNLISNWIDRHYHMAVVRFLPPENVFERVFDTSEPDLVAEVYSVRGDDGALNPDHVDILTQKFEAATGLKAATIPTDEQLEIVIDKERMSLYGISEGQVHGLLTTALNENYIGTLRSYQQYMPIVLSSPDKPIEQLISELTLRGQSGAQIPLRELIKLNHIRGYKSIEGRENGVYTPFRYHHVKDPYAVARSIETTIADMPNYGVNFSGNVFKDHKMIRELVIILLISILIMYFILSSQFESFIQPLIVLLEIPIDIALALIVLALCGISINMMSGIGLIVSGGIIINDSILKINMINELRQANMPIEEAIHMAGKRRLRSIVMTSLTTIFAMLPILFTFDLGSELQKPLTVAMISTMVIGVLVSLFIVPVMYYLIYRGRSESQQPTVIKESSL